MTTNHGPVNDWATDFDHLDRGWVEDPYPIWDDLRARCPVAHSERFGGAWLPVRHADIAAIAHDVDHFTSWYPIVSDVRPGADFGDPPRPVGRNPPITSDPPFHGRARRVLLPPFSPKAVAALEASTRQFCDKLLDGLAGRDCIDAAVEFAQQVPVQVIMRLLGFPLEDGDLFRDFLRESLEEVDAPVEERVAKLAALRAYFDARIAEHVAEPRDDLTSYLLDAELDTGQKLTHEHVRGTLSLLMAGGIDTTWSALGAALWHLADHPGDRRRLAAEPGLMATAVEEFLRAYAPVTMARLVDGDYDFEGHAMKDGDWVLLPFPAANRDPEAFPDADRILIDRAINRHAAFGLGIHRCLGSNLARMELRVALEAWMRHFPEFELIDPGAVTWSAGQVRGPRSVRVRILAQG